MNDNLYDNYLTWAQVNGFMDVAVSSDVVRHRVATATPQENRYAIMHVAALMRYVVPLDQPDGPASVSEDAFRLAWSNAYWQARDEGQLPHECTHHADMATASLLDRIEEA